MTAASLVECHRNRNSRRSCVIIKVRAAESGGISDSQDGFDGSLIDQRLLVLDTLGHTVEVNLDKENGQKDYGKLVPSVGHVISVHYAPFYGYPSGAREAVNFLQLQKNGSFDVPDRDYHKITLRVMGQGEPPPLDQDSYVCVTTNPGKGEYESKAVGHSIYSFFEDVKL
jgi:hypothetical protein